MNKIKPKPAYIFIALLAVIILFYVSISFGVTLRNSFKAYEMIKHNYGYFNYPNTIQVHSGKYVEDTEDQFFVGKISAENAYGQRIYDGYFASGELFTSFETIEEIGLDVPDYIREESEKKNVFVPVVNFLIGMDW